MYTQAQLAQVKQVFINTQRRFPTQEELERIYDYDYAGYMQYKLEEDRNATFEEYFGDIFEDAYGYEAFACTIEDALGQGEACGLDSEFEFGMVEDV